MSKMDIIATEDRRRRQHPNVMLATKKLLEVSHVAIPTGARVARVTVVLTDIPGNRKKAKEIDFSPCVNVYIDNEGNPCLVKEKK